MRAKTYLVGGAVRDQLLGLEISDRDWVVVGSTAEAMIAQGFRPVGRDFPVFLHPKSHEEYALARKERKEGHGYAGFVFYADADVSLEEDLMRRDLTINAMAMDITGRLIDPFGGQNDLKKGILRHVSTAFSEDPLRILRTARFAARFHFTVANDTLRLMRSMVKNGEIFALHKDRIRQEISKGLMENKPSLMFDVLRQTGALAALMPEIDALFGIPQRPQNHPEIDCGIHTMMVLDQAALMQLPVDARYAALTHDLGKARTPREQWPSHQQHELRGNAPLTTLNQRLNSPRPWTELAALVQRYHGLIHSISELSNADIVNVLQHCDAFRRPDRFALLLQVCKADCRGRLSFENQDYPQKQQWLYYLKLCQALDYRAIANSCDHPKKITHAITQARITTIKNQRLN